MVEYVISKGKDRKRGIVLMYYSDRPISQESEDLLERRYFANLLAKTLLNLNSQDTFTVGLYGKWGSGKTSIVNMMLEQLDKLQSDQEDKMLVLRFDPWHFTDTTQLINQFQKERVILFRKIKSFTFNKEDIICIFY